MGGVHPIGSCRTIARGHADLDASTRKRIQLDTDDRRTAASGSGQNHAVTATEVDEHIGRTDPKDIQNGIDHGRMQPAKRCEHIRRTTTDAGPGQRDMTSWGQHGFSRHDEGCARRLPRRIRAGPQTTG